MESILDFKIDLTNRVRPLSMNPRKSLTIALLLSGISLGLFGVFLYFIIQSGCAGDLKGGSQGDPIEALRLEGVAFAFLAAGILIGSVAAALIPYQALTQRVISAVAFFGVAGITLWFVAFFIQEEAVRHCFAA